MSLEIFKIQTVAGNLWLGNWAMVWLKLAFSRTASRSTLGIWTGASYLPGWVAAADCSSWGGKGDWENSSLQSSQRQVNHKPFTFQWSQVKLSYFLLSGQSDFEHGSFWLAERDSVAHLPCRCTDFIRCALWSWPRQELELQNSDNLLPITNELITCLQINCLLSTFLEIKSVLGLWSYIVCVFIYVLVCVI